MRKTWLFIACLALPVFGEETLTLGCYMPCLLDSEPKTAFEKPSCNDYDLNGALIDALGHGDRSAMELLQRRHDTTFALNEKLRIAGALLRHVDDDHAYWNEIAAPAEDAVRLIGTPELDAWCAERGLERDDYQTYLYTALDLAGHDPRGRELLLRALQSNDLYVVANAIISFGLNGEKSALPAIETALRRFPAEERLAFVLFAFHSEATDDLAKRYLSEETFEDYKLARDEHLQ